MSKVKAYGYTRNINAVELHLLGAVTLFIIYKVDKLDIVDEGNEKRVKKDKVLRRSGYDGRIIL